MITRTEDDEYNEFTFGNISSLNSDNYTNISNRKKYVQILKVIALMSLIFSVVISNNKILDTISYNLNE